jgi:hypothetical protein
MECPSGSKVVPKIPGGSDEEFVGTTGHILPSSGGDASVEVLSSGGICLSSISHSNGTVAASMSFLILGGRSPIVATNVDRDRPVAT